MTDAELDCLRDLEYEKAWEELNRVDPHCEAAVALLNKAAEAVATAVVLLQEAAGEVEHLPETDRVMALANDLEDLWCAVGAQAKRLGG